MVELESEGELTRSEVAAFLRDFADELDGGGFDDTRERGPGERRDEFTDEGSHASERITFIVGDDSATVTVPDAVEFDVEVGSRSPLFSSTVSQEIELELSWETEAHDAELSGDRIDIE